MSTDLGRELLFLGLLRRAPLCAYDVDRVVRNHIPLYHPLKKGNVYNALAKLAARRLLLVRNVAAERGPARTKKLYRLSAAGEKRFHELLRTIVCDAQADDATLEIAYVLLGQIPRSTALALLREREVRVLAHEQRLGRFFGNVSARSASGQLAANHAFGRAAADLRFLREAIGMLRGNRWEAGWQSDDGPVTDSERKL